MIKDAGGLLTARSDPHARAGAARRRGHRPLELHSHCLTGLAPLVYLEGARLGCDQLHLSIKPLANGAAQPAVQTWCATSARRAIASISTIGDRRDRRALRGIAEREGKPVGVPVEYDAFHYEHQIPGGMLSNFREQLARGRPVRQVRRAAAECARVRRELAWPIMITPFSQFVGTQAVLNVCTASATGSSRRGEEIRARLLRQAARARSIRTCSTASSPTARATSR